MYVLVSIASQVDGVQLLADTLDAMATLLLPKLIMPLWGCALSCDFAVQWMKVGVTTKETTSTSDASHADDSGLSPNSPNTGSNLDSAVDAAVTLPLATVSDDVG